MKQEEEERKAREREENMTPEEKLAEKLRLQKIQEEADLHAAMDTFGITDKSGIDALQPKNKTELTELADAISKKVSQFKHLADFTSFLEDLVRNVCANRKCPSQVFVKDSLLILSIRLDATIVFVFDCFQLALAIYRKSKKPSTICTPKNKNSKRKRAKRVAKEKQK